MKPKRILVGHQAAPVLTLDEAGLHVAEIASIAAALAPFPPATNNYPGVRRVFGPAEHAAWNYVFDLLEAAKPYIVGAFDLDGFELVEASFSIVTTQPARLTGVQRVPHFDSVDADQYALLHYVSPCSGTAFYRHLPSGIEIVTPQNVDSYVAQARAAAARAPAAYIRTGSPDYAQTGKVDGAAGRLVAYPANLLHSGVIEEHFPGSPDPEVGRLTTNIFIRGWRND